MKSQRHLAVLNSHRVFLPAPLKPPSLQTKQSNTSGHISVKAQHRRTWSPNTRIPVLCSDIWLTSCLTEDFAGIIDPGWSAVCLCSSAHGLEIQNSWGDGPRQRAAPARIPPFSIAELAVLPPATQAHFQVGKSWAEQALGVLSCVSAQCSREETCRPGLARTRNFPPLTSNEWFLFCWKFVMEFLHSVPQIRFFFFFSGYCLLSQPQKHEKKWKYLKQRGFWFFTLKTFQQGISAESAVRPWSFLTMPLARLPKGTLLGSKNSNTEFTIFGQKQVHLLRTMHVAPHLSLSSPLFCPSPFLCFPSALQCTLSKYLEGLFCRGFAYDFCKCQQAW